MDSPSATNIIDLPNDLGSSAVAAIAAGAPAATAIPPPIPARPVTRPAAKSPIPFELSTVSVAVVAAEASAAEELLSSAAKTLTERAAIRTVSTAKVARFTATERLMLLP